MNLIQLKETASGIAQIVPSWLQSFFLFWRTTSYFLATACKEYEKEKAEEEEEKEEEEVVEENEEEEEEEEEENEGSGEKSSSVKSPS